MWIFDVVVGSGGCLDVYGNGKFSFDAHTKWMNHNIVYILMS